MMIVSRHQRGLLALVALALFLAACAPGEPRSSTFDAGDKNRETGVQVPRGILRIAWGVAPQALNSKVFPGTGSLNQLSAVFNSALTYFDPSGTSYPMIAREVPTTENGGLAINGDGTMGATYRLRDNAQWDDGTELTAQDFVFAFEVYTDPDLAIYRRVPENLMAGVSAPDAHTVVVTWMHPYLRAGTLTHQELMPLPRHLLEEKARTNKPNFTVGPEWTSEYVGSGPFRVERWDPGVSLIARANLNWFLGPPKLDRLDIRFFGDPNTSLANLLSGEIDMTADVTVSAAAGVREQWTGQGPGYIAPSETGLIYLEFQSRQFPGWQPAVSDVRVRSALLHAIDRASLAEVMTSGLGSVAHMFLLPVNPAFGDASQAVVKYAYDPNRAAALLQEAGWTRDSGGFASNARGEPLKMSLYGTTDSGGATQLAVIADNWKGAGIEPDVLVIPAARSSDSEFRVSFPAVNLGNRPVAEESFPLLSSESPTLEKRWQGINRGSFSDGEIDGLFDVLKRATTVEQWRQATVALHRRVSEVVGIGPLYYRQSVVMARNEVQGIRWNYQDPTLMWNIFEWRLADQ